ncbi:MAG: aminotransferase class V-fold PLP-dependent enzyme, partial [Planctomycetaceae bacterium]|nr:aminotransferase class V-fold PLP-dependent enzyme [Planctomycetaceae bacterium]
MFWPIDEIRAQFPGLQRTQGGVSVALFDGPAGSQVPQSVIDAVSHYLGHTNCNRGAAFATSIESDQVLEDAHDVLAAFLGTSDPQSVIFGPNMTSITLQVSRALSRNWQAGDEIIVSRLDHDANVTPWILAAQDRGVTVHQVDLNPDDWTLDLDDFHRKLSSRTVLVAVGYASNATGTINPLHQMIPAARQVGALTYVDAVHYAPHGRINVTELGFDFLACS